MPRRTVYHGGSMDQATRDRIRADYLRSLDIARQMIPGLDEFVPGAEADMRRELEEKGIGTRGTIEEPRLWWPDEYAGAVAGIDGLGLSPNGESIEGIALDEVPVVGDARAEPQSAEERALREYDEADGYE